MNNRADFVVYSPDDKVQLVVEVKNKIAATDDWAAKMRRNLIAHSIIPESKFLLLALPEYFYLWRDNFTPDLVPADYKIRTREALKRYLGDTNLDKLTEPGFELLVSFWLKDLTRMRPSEDLAKEQSWLFQSGLYESIRGGSVQTETAA